MSFRLFGLLIPAAGKQWELLWGNWATFHAVNHSLSTITDATVLTVGNYWSSSEDGNSFAWRITLTDGVLFPPSKSTSHRVRCIRMYQRLCFIHRDDSIHRVQPVRNRLTGVVQLSFIDYFREMLWEQAIDPAPIKLFNRIMKEGFDNTHWP